MSNQPVLATTDLSEPADEALRRASEWAQLRGAKLIVCHVMPRLVGSHMLFPQAIEQEVLEQPEVEGRLTEAVRERTRAATGRDARDFDVVIADGEPAAEIGRQAEAFDVQLVAVGSHSHAALASIFLGNVAEDVARHAPSSVLVVRPKRKSGSIVVATDFSDAAFAALVVAAEQARLTDARVILMCSIQKSLEAVMIMSTLGSGYQFVEQEHQELHRDAERRLAALLDRAGIAGDTVVADADAAVEAVHLASERDADLVVVGATDKGLHHLRFGRLAGRVTRHAPCSVLLVRAPARRER
jgi:nucleotide-binding universal stress UspA family protein